MKTYQVTLRRKGTSERTAININATSKLHAYNVAWAFFEGFDNLPNNFEKLYSQLSEMTADNITMNQAGKYFVPLSGTKTVK